MRIKSQQKKAYELALLAVLFWSTVGSAFKLTLRYISSDELVFWAVVNGIVVLILINLFGRNKLTYQDVTPKAVLSSAIMGFFNPFLYYLILIKAYDLLEAQIAGTLNYFWPIILVLLSVIMLGQKIKPLGLLAVFISFLGIVIISTGGNPVFIHFNNLKGVLLALGSAFLWAVYWILNMKDPRNAASKILLNMVFGLIYLIIWFLIQGGLPEVPPFKGYFGTLYIGIFEMGLTFVIWLKALNYSSDTAKISNLIYLAPFIGLFWISFVVGETIHLYTVVGLAFIVTGILIQTRQK